MRLASESARRLSAGQHASRGDARRRPHRAQRLRAPLRAVAPYHLEDPDEEWLLVVSGTPTLRHSAGEDVLEPWDVVFFPSGPAGAHHIRIDSDSPARVAMFSSITAVGAVVYPDRDMIQIFTTDGAGDIVVERSSGVDEAAPWST